MEGNGAERAQRLSWAWKLEWDFSRWEEGRAFLAKESVGQRAGNRTEPECSRSFKLFSVVEAGLMEGYGRREGWRSGGRRGFWKTRPVRALYCPSPCLPIISISVPVLPSGAA